MNFIRFVDFANTERIVNVASIISVSVTPEGTTIDTTDGSTFILSDDFEIVLNTIRRADGKIFKVGEKPIVRAA